MTHDVIISYVTPDKPIADAVCAKLEERGIHCWIAPRDIFSSENCGEAIIKAIDSAKILVLILSSKANASPHVMREAERAVHDGIPIIPFRIEDVQPNRSLQYYIGPQHWLDALTPPLEAHILKLAEVISPLLGKTPHPSRLPRPRPRHNLPPTRNAIAKKDHPVRRHSPHRGQRDHRRLLQLYQQHNPHNVIINRARDNSSRF
jgi:TIR domain